MDYPPGTGEDDFRKIPKGFREDAIQEAWVAHLGELRQAELEGREPRPGVALAAARTYASRERRFEKRHLAALSADGPTHTGREGRFHARNVAHVPLEGESARKEGGLKAEDLGLHYDPYHGLCRDDT
jgi:hypothetical protein